MIYVSIQMKICIQLRLKKYSLKQKIIIGRKIHQTFSFCGSFSNIRGSSRQTRMRCEELRIWVGFKQRSIVEQFYQVLFWSNIMLSYFDTYLFDTAQKLSDRSIVSTKLWRLLLFWFACFIWAGLHLSSEREIVFDLQKWQSNFIFKICKKINTMKIND